MERCVICLEPGGHLISVTDKGRASLAEFAVLRKDERVIADLSGGGAVHVHETCCKWFNNWKRISMLNQSEENQNNVLKV